MMRKSSPHNLLKLATRAERSASNMHSVAPALLGGKQFPAGLFYEHLFRGIPVRQAMDAADTDSHHPVRGIAVRDVEHAHLFAQFARVLAQRLYA